MYSHIRDARREETFMVPIQKGGIVRQSKEPVGQSRIQRVSSRLEGTEMESSLFRKTISRAIATCR